MELIESDNWSWDGEVDRVSIALQFSLHFIAVVSRAAPAGFWTSDLEISEQSHHLFHAIYLATLIDGGGIFL